jgi:hypothetical protein
MPHGNFTSTASESLADSASLNIRGSPYEAPSPTWLKCARAPRKTRALRKRGQKVKPILQRSSVVAALMGVLILTGCQANGGGTLASFDSTCSRPVTFGFAFTLPTLGADGTFAGSFVDPCAVVGPIHGVSLRGTGALTPSAPPQGQPVFGACMSGVPSYQSTDPRNPGSGLMSLIVCDSANAFGQGAAGGTAQNTVGDLVLIQVTSGPYAPYSFTGVVAQGNIVMRQ